MNEKYVKDLIDFLASRNARELVPCVFDARTQVIIALRERIVRPVSRDMTIAALYTVAVLG